MSQSLIANSYIVLLKEAADHDVHLNWLQARESQFRASARAADTEPESDVPLQVNHTYDIFKGYAAILSESALEQVKNNEDVEAVVPDSFMYANSEATPTAGAGAPGKPVQTMKIQNDAPWGLQRASSQERLPEGSSPGALSYEYRWTTGLQETEVDVYVLDTGVFIKHEEFNGRARWGTTLGGYKDADGHGHGTHVAGTIAGKRFGVAKSANIVAVKILGDNGSGRTSDIVAGIQWAVKSAGETKRASIINMSLGGEKSIALDRAVTRATNQGVHVCVAAGNDGIDARDQSPAGAEGAITVGAANIKDEMADFSNFGKAVDIFAPGEGIVSASTKSPTASKSLDGTSMATPHVAGMLAWMISVGGYRSPAELKAEIQKIALKDKLTKVLGPEDTPNLLLSNGL